MATIAEQLRAERRRRERRRRGLAGAATVGLLAFAFVVDRPTDVGAAPATALDPGVMAAFEAAAAEARAVGHELVITSGYRTPEHQAELLQAEIAERGSVDEAMRWVFPPDRSMHVHGLAVDVGPGGAADWLAAEGGRYGLCRTLAWEWWHFEWRQRWQDAGGCPLPVHDPADAPGV